MFSVLVGRWWATMQLTYFEAYLLTSLFKPWQKLSVDWQLTMRTMMVVILYSYKTSWMSFSGSWTCVRVTTATRCRRWRWSPKLLTRSSQRPTRSKAASASSWRPPTGWWRTRSWTRVESGTRSTRRNDAGERSTTASETTAPRSLTRPSSSRTGRRSVFEDEVENRTFI